jgi:hypothetical protein
MLGDGVGFVQFSNAAKSDRRIGQLERQGARGACSENATFKLFGVTTGRQCEMCDVESDTRSKFILETVGFIACGAQC